MKWARDFISPARFLDRLIIGAFRLGWRGLAEALVYWGRGAHGQNLIFCHVGGGVDLWLNPHNYIDRILLAGRRHDQDVLDALGGEIRPGDVLWDVGANIGFIGLSLLAGRNDFRVVAFEPSPFSFAQLSLNNRLNGNRMRLVPVALSDAPGMRSFSVKINRNSGQSTLRPDAKFSYDGDFPVSCETGDRMTEIAPAPNLIKIDVEGAEWWVLSGMQKTLASPGLRAVLFEGPTAEHEAIVALLHDFGFRSVTKLTERAQSNFLARRGA